MALSKTFSTESEFVEAVLNGAHNALWAVNGRLSGFIPVVTAGTGDTGTPGITSTTVSGGTRRLFNVNLVAVPIGGEKDDDTVAVQTTSYAIANGVILKSDATVVVSTSLLDVLAIGDTSDKLVISAAFDSTRGTGAVFSVTRESVIDASPTTSAKLAYYDPEVNLWTAFPQISMRGVFHSLQSFLTQQGGFAVTKAAPLTIQIGPGAIIGSLKRVVNKSIRLVATPPAPVSALNYRRDLLVVNDPVDETATPVFQIIVGATEDPVLGNVANPPSPTLPSQVPLAEIVMFGGGVSPGIFKIDDVRPFLAWQTDAVMRTIPEVFASLLVKSAQPGVHLRDSLSGSNQEWAVQVFRSVPGSSPSVTLDRSKLIFGIVGPQQVRVIFGEVVPGSFLPDPVTAFPKAPYTLKDSLVVYSTSAGADVTNDTAYTVGFDYLNGSFLPPGITSALPSEVFQITYKQVSALFALDEDGTIHFPDLDLLRAHLAPTNPKAHLALNIQYDNTNGHITTLTPFGPVDSQRAIDAIAQQAFASTTGGAVRNTDVVFIQSSGLIYMPGFNPHDPDGNEADADTEFDGGTRASYKVLYAGQIEKIGVALSSNAYGNLNPGAGCDIRVIVNGVRPDNPTFSIVGTIYNAGSTHKVAADGYHTLATPIALAEGQSVQLSYDFPGSGGPLLLGTTNNITANAHLAIKRT